MSNGTIFCLSGAVTAGLTYAATAALTTINPVAGLTAGFTFGVLGGPLVPLTTKNKNSKLPPFISKVANITAITFASIGVAKLTCLALGAPLGFKAALILAGVTLGSGLGTTALGTAVVTLCALAIIGGFTVAQ